MFTLQSLTFLTPISYNFSSVFIIIQTKPKFFVFPHFFLIEPPAIKDTNKPIKVEIEVKRKALKNFSMIMKQCDLS